MTPTVPAGHSEPLPRSTYWTESSPASAWPPSGPALDSPIGFANDDLELQRTKTGLLLSAIGFGLSWIPVIGILGGLFGLLGLIYLFLGRDAFDEAHHRLVVLGAGLFILSIVLTIVVTLSFSGSIIQTAQQPGETPNEFASALTGSLQGYFLALLVTSFIALIAQVVLIVRIADRTSQALLVLGVVTGCLISVVLYELLVPQISTALQAATNGTTINTAPIDALQNQVQVLGILKIIPDLLFALAYWRTRESLPDSGTSPPRPPPGGF